MVAGAPCPWTPTTWGHRLVIEYRERQHDEPIAHFDKPDVLTVSGVHRGIQRRIYDERRAADVPAHGLRLIVVRPDDLMADRRGRLLRHRAADEAALRVLLLRGGTIGHRLSCVNARLSNKTVGFLSRRRVAARTVRAQGRLSARHRRTHHAHSDPRTSVGGPLRKRVCGRYAPCTAHTWRPADRRDHDGWLALETPTMGAARCATGLSNGSRTSPE
jgi:hypothetical protein